MSLSVGIVGLPNVGKSTLFNVLTHTQQAAAANYPFCTIEPNQATVPVPDPRLDKLAALAKPKKVCAATIDFVDIAGLVRGASRGDGLGNQFLAHIREVNTIIMVVRCFEDSDVVHVEGDVNPIRDVQIIETELLLADIQSVERALDRIARQARADKELRPQLAELEELKQHLDGGLAARSFKKTTDKPRTLPASLQLLTDKPIIYCANLDDTAIADPEKLPAFTALRDYARHEKASVIAIAAQLEAELCALPPEEQASMLSAYGMSESGLEQTIRLAYQTLGLISYFTVGPIEVHAWTVRRGTRAPQAAGVIHSDFERGFIRAEVTPYADYIQHGSDQACRAAAVLRLEGKEYVMQDGDVTHFLFNV